MKRIIFLLEEPSMLESWYPGALDAPSAAYSRPELSGLGRKAKYRNPDDFGSPSVELSRLNPEFRKIEGTRRMGQQMPTTESGNRSRSFQVFMQGVRKITEEVRQAAAEANR